MQTAQEEESRRAKEAEINLLEELRKTKKSLEEKAESSAEKAERNLLNELAKVNKLLAEKENSEKTLQETTKDE